MTNDSTEYLTFSLAGQMFGLSVLQVNDVLSPQKITRTPLSPSSVAGIMNLRGRIVTAIDVRNCLGQALQPPDVGGMGIVIEKNNELFNLIIDSVGDVLNLAPESLEEVPPTLDSAWRTVASRIHKLERELLVILDTERLLESIRP